MQNSSLFPHKLVGAVNTTLIGQNQQFLNSLTLYAPGLMKSRVIIQGSLHSGLSMSYVNNLHMLVL